MTRLPLLVLAGAAGLTVACRGGERPPVAAQHGTLADSADQILYKAHFAITDGGIRRADVLGDTAYFFNNGTRIILRPLIGTFFGANGSKDGIMQAREGVYDTRLGTLDARGDVMINTLDGKRLESPHCRFDQRLNQITSDTTFFLSEPDREVRGIGFMSDADLTTFRVTKLLGAKAGTVAVP